MKDTAETIDTLYPTMAPARQHDYEELRRLLSVPSRIALGLGALEAAVNAVHGHDERFGRHYVDDQGTTVPFDRVEIALLDMEARFGFSDVVVIPSSGRPFDDPNYGSNRVTLDDWTAMLQDRHPMRDYGASRPHGEITHRIQWFVICSAFENRTLRLTNNARRTVLELYRSATIPSHRRQYFRPSDNITYTKTVWSDLFDYGLTKVIDGRSTLWIQREVLFFDWKNYFPMVSSALRSRFIARGGCLDPWAEENRQFFDGSKVPDRPPVKM